MPARHKFEEHSLLSMQGEPSGLGVSQIPLTHRPEAQTAAEAQVAPVGSGAAHRPLVPQMPLLHWLGLLQGVLTGSPASHSPLGLHCREAHCALRVQGTFTGKQLLAELEVVVVLVG